MGVYVPNMEKPEYCRICHERLKCKQYDGEILYTPDDCPLIEIDDEIWENEKYKLIRMTQEARINKEMAERRADEHNTERD